MKRIFSLILLSIGLLVSATPAFGQTPWSIDAFHADLTVRRDGTLEVRETVAVDFVEPRHGIYRYVPYTGKNDQGKAYRLNIALESATRDGIVEHVSTTKRDGNVIWKLGDADNTLAGQHTYVLTYVVDGAIGRFDAFDEIYWNVTGNGWDVPLPAVTARVVLPEGTMAKQNRCYTGEQGSTAENCTVVGNGSNVYFTSERQDAAMTVAVGFPKGVVAAPTLWKRAQNLFYQYGIWLLPFLMFVGMYSYWFKHGKELPLGATVVQYEPPKGLTPAETQSLLLQTTQPQQLAPTIIDLASRGYFTIEEGEKKGLLLNAKEYTLTLVKDGRTDMSLQPFGRELLSALFKGDVGERVEVSSLRKTFYQYYPKFISGVMASLTERGHFEKNPDTVRLAWILLGAGFVMSSFILTAYIVPLFVTGAITFVFGWQMPRWSPVGIAAVRQARGYREFISKVEKYRAPWMEDQNVFFRVLPYALAFGLGSKWAKAFADLKAQPPSWYHGSNLAVWSTVDFTRSLDGLAKNFASAATSSRSGSGGGGFSGGGFGGGGGGSW